MQIQLHIAKTENGWLAATESSPYFCVEAQTELAVLDKARAAISFYAENIEVISIFHSNQEQATKTPKLTDARRELISA